MNATPGTPTHQWRQYVAFGVLSLVAAGFTLSLSQGGAGVFEPYFGSIPPLWAITLTALVGLVSLAFLQSRGWFEICGELVYIHGTNHSHLVVTGNVTWDVLAPTNGRPRAVTPFLIARGGAFQTREHLFNGTYTSSEGRSQREAVCGLLSLTA